jgi:hypothetical protein
MKGKIFMRKKRILSLLVAFAMVLSFIPTMIVNVGADDPAPTVSVELIARSSDGDVTLRSPAVAVTRGQQNVTLTITDVPAAALNFVSLAIRSAGASFAEHAEVGTSVAAHESFGDALVNVTNVTIGTVSVTPTMNAAETTAGGRGMITNLAVSCDAVAAGDPPAITHGETCTVVNAPRVNVGLWNAWDAADRRIPATAGLNVAAEAWGGTAFALDPAAAVGTISVTFSVSEADEGGGDTREVSHPWSVGAFPHGDGVTRTAATDHVLALTVPALFAQMSGAGTLNVAYATGQNAGSSRRILAWTNLSGPDAGVIEFLTSARTTGGDGSNGVSASPALASADTTATVALPASLLVAADGTVATTIYVSITTNSSLTEGNPFAVNGAHRGGGSNNEFARLATVTLTANVPDDGSPIIDRAALNSAITAATELRTNTHEAADGAAIPADVTWATAEARATYLTAIEAAQAAAALAETTQEAIDAAVAALAEATTAFTRAPGALAARVFTTIDAAITAATNMRTATRVSADGAGVFVDEHWATQEAVTAITEAIAAATTARTSFVQAEIDAAAEALTTATATFGEARTAGTTERPSAVWTIAPVLNAEALEGATGALLTLPLNTPRTATSNNRAIWVWTDLNTMTPEAIEAAMRANAPVAGQLIRTGQVEGAHTSTNVSIPLAMLQSETAFATTIYFGGSLNTGSDPADFLRTDILADITLGSIALDVTIAETVCPHCRTGGVIAPPLEDANDRSWMNGNTLFDDTAHDGGAGKRGTLEFDIMALIAGTRINVEDIFGISALATHPGTSATGGTSTIIGHFEVLGEVEDAEGEIGMTVIARSPTFRSPSSGDSSPGTVIITRDGVNRTMSFMRGMEFSPELNEAAQTAGSFVEAGATALTAVLIPHTGWNAANTGAKNRFRIDEITLLGADGVVLGTAVYNSEANVWLPFASAQECVLCPHDNCNRSVCQECIDLCECTELVWTQLTAATCAAAGSEQQWCSTVGCETRGETRAIEALGHLRPAVPAPFNPDEPGVWTLTTPATCLVAGVLTTTCGREGCEHDVTAEIAALGHDTAFNNVWLPSRGPDNCGQAVQQTATCGRTGCTATQTRELPAGVCGHPGCANCDGQDCTPEAPCGVCPTCAGSGTVNKAPLTSAVTAAGEALGGVTISADGAGLAPGTFWVTQAVRDAFNEAIQAAQAVISNADATQAQVTEALNALTTAQNTFNGARTQVPTAPVCTPAAPCGTCADCLAVGCECRNCTDCGLKGGVYGFGNVRGRMNSDGTPAHPEVTDAIQILRSLVGLSNVITDPTRTDEQRENSFIAGNITRAGQNVSDLQVTDAIQVLRFVVNLTNQITPSHS